MRARRSADGPALVTWGYYAVVEVPEIPRDMLPEKVVRDTREECVDFYPRTFVAKAEQKAFWAAWFSERPTDEVWIEPDNFGFVVGPQAWSEAFTIAYRALQAGKGARVYGMHIGERFARLAYRDGAPVVRSDFTDFVQHGMQSLGFFQLDLRATETDVRRAFRAAVLEQHPDQRDQNGRLVQGKTRVDMNELRRKKDFAIGLLRMQRKAPKAPPP